MSEWKISNVLSNNLISEVQENSAKNRELLMSLSDAATKMVKTIFRWAGLDVIRINNSPRITLLGLRQLPFQTIIDVGANTGQFARNISGFFPSANIFCFEPLPVAFGTLSEWAKTQNGRVTAFNLAISDQLGEAEMFFHEEHSPSSSLLATTELTKQYYPFTREQKRICVKQMTLDSALAEAQNELLPEILVKLDVQGYEDRVIVGGTEIFRKASACIVEVSLDKLYEGQAGFMDLLTMFDDLGYRYIGNLEQTYGEYGHCVFIDAVFIKKNKSNR